MTQVMIEAAPKQAYELFNSWAGIDAPDLPTDPVDAMQVELVRWQHRNFGNVSPVGKINVHMGLGVIEEYCECLAAKELGGSKGKLDGLGDLCVYSGQMLIGNRLAIRPVMQMADAYIDLWDETDPEKIPTSDELIGLFCHKLLKREQLIRGMHDDDAWRAALCSNIAQLLASAKQCIYYEDVEVEFTGLIERTYIDVGKSVVLKRDWVFNPGNGVSQ